MNKTISIGDLILEALEKTVDGYVRLEDFLYNTHIYAKGYDRPLKKSSFAQALRRLREKGFVEFDQSELIIKLSDEGKARAVWKRIKNSKSKWDKKWRIVAFDIPEKYRVTRNLFRRRLREFSFTQMQKSVWISKIDCVDILRWYVRDLGITTWVSILEAENLDFGKS